jgi:hypothetical protein
MVFDRIIIALYFCLSMILNRFPSLWAVGPAAAAADRHLPVEPRALGIVLLFLSVPPFFRELLQPGTIIAFLRGTPRRRRSSRLWCVGLCFPVLRR